jgi:hypothetical protein
MSDSADLERRYRRLLALYPRAFRREYEQEILAVLMAGADDGQHRPRPGEAADLIRRATWMRLRPRVSRSQPTVLWAVGLIYVCAALKLLGVPILPAPSGSTPQPLHIGISWGVFALLAWANGRRYGWATVLFGVWFGLHTAALVAEIAQGSAFSAPVWSLIGTVVFWLVELSALVLIVSAESREAHARSPRRDTGSGFGRSWR